MSSIICKTTTYSQFLRGTLQAGAGWRALMTSLIQSFFSLTEGWKMSGEIEYLLLARLKIKHVPNSKIEFVLATDPSRIMVQIIPKNTVDNLGGRLHIQQFLLMTNVCWGSSRLVTHFGSHRRSYQVCSWTEEACTQNGVNSGQWWKVILLLSTKKWLSACLITEVKHSIEIKL